MEHHSFFSESTGGFYDAVDIATYEEAGVLPDDLIGVSEQEKDALLVALNSGYAAKVANGKIALVPVDVPQSIPQNVTRFQARAALLQTPSVNGYDHMLAESEAVIAHEDTDEMMRMAWAESPELWRNSPLMSRLAEGLDLSEQEVDDLMILAASIEPWLYSRG